MRIRSELTVCWKLDEVVETLMMMSEKMTSEYVDVRRQIVSVSVRASTPFI